MKMYEYGCVVCIYVIFECAEEWNIFWNLVSSPPEILFVQTSADYKKPANQLDDKFSEESLAVGINLREGQETKI